MSWAQGIRAIIGCFRGSGGIALSVVLAVLVLTPSGALAQTSRATGPADFTSQDGTTQVSGDIVEFDGRTYLVRTTLGDLILDADLVTCTGAACPPQSAISAGFTIAGPKRLLTRLLPAVIEAHTRTAGAAMIRTADAGGLTGFNLTTDISTAPRRINLLPLSVAETVEALVDGRADFALVDRAFTPQEIRRIRLDGRGDMESVGHSRLLAREATRVIVSPRNGVTQIGLDALADVVSGRITDWASLGGAQGQIRVLASKEDGSLFRVLNARVLNPQRRRPGPKVEWLADDRAVARAVSRDPLALGIVGDSSASGLKAVTLEGRCGMTLDPGGFAVRAGGYPLAADIWVYLADGVRLGSAQEFWRFLASQNALDAVADAGFEPNAVAEKRLDDMGHWLAAAIAAPEADTTLVGLQDLIETVSGARRLSVTFRFGTAEIDPVPNSPHMLQDLATAMARIDPAEVLVLGFADTIGSADRNQSLAAAHADTVASLIAPYLGGDGSGDPQISARAFGELAPLACSDTEAGRRINKRVEIWVR